MAGKLAVGMWLDRHDWVYFRGALRGVSTAELLLEICWSQRASADGLATALV